MPNHCSQDLYVYGSEDSINDFVEFSKQGDQLLSADKYIPYPKEYKELDEKAEIARQNKDYSVVDGFNSGGYEWCINNWGTKWGIYNAELTKQKLAGKRSQVNYTFESAWSPAIPIIHAMSLKYPDLSFKLKYYEMGCAFKGVYEVEGGNILKDIRAPYKGNRGG